MTEAVVALSIILLSLGGNMSKVSRTSVLRSTAAIGALALLPAGVQAQCSRNGSVVTCTGANTANQIEAAVNSGPAPSVSLIIAQGATVVRPDTDIRPSNPPFSGAIGFTNNGTVGANSANFVDFRYNGSIEALTNTFTFNNAGTLNGGIFASNVGGAITGTNSGIINRGVQLATGAGAISLTSSGSIFNLNGSSDTAISLISVRTQSTVATTGARTTTTASTTGGLITANITGPVAEPAIAATPTSPAVAESREDILARSIGGVNLTVDNVARNINADTRTNIIPTQFTEGPVTTGTTTTSSNGFNQRIVGADAAVTVGTNGRVNNLFVQSGTGAATATINGTVGSATSPASVVAQANGIANDVLNTNTTTTGTPNNTVVTMRQDVVRNGGAATATVGNTAQVFGNVTANSNAGPATVAIAGRTGSAPANIIGNVAAVSGAPNTGFNFTSTQNNMSRSDGTFNNVLTGTNSAAGRAATVTIGAGADINGSAVASSCGGDATNNNSGRVHAVVSASAICIVPNITLAETSSFTRTTSASGTVSEVELTTKRNTNSDVGGTATVVNGNTAVIDGNVGSNGFGGASLTNAGVILGNIGVVSRGFPTIFDISNETTTTRTPGGATTVANLSIEMQRVTPSDGVASGDYSGTVGAGQGSSLAGALTVTHSGNRGSVATVSGTLFADYNGSSGARDLDRTITQSQATVTEAATGPATPASRRSVVNTRRDSAVDVPSTTSLTLNGGSILNNGTGTGDVVLDSRGGNANLMMTGGTIGGNATVRAGTGGDPSSLSTSRIINEDLTQEFTRAAATSGPAPLEVQQSQSLQRSETIPAIRGIANVSLTSGTIAGNLDVSGTGSGAGTLGANVTIAGTIGTAAVGGGQLTVGGSRNDFNRTINDVTTRASATRVDQVRTETVSSRPSTANGGGLLVDVSGTVRRGIDAQTGTGPATVNVTGRVGTASPTGVFIRSADVDSTITETSTTRASTFGGTQTTIGFSRTTSQTATGGTATLNVAGGPAVLSANASSIEGNINVAGRAGSVVTIGSGSRILQSSGGLSVGENFANGTSSDASTFNAAGAQTGSTRTATAAAVGGPASLTNAGIIGSAGNNANVEVRSVGGATASNSGTLNGGLLVNAIGSSTSTTTVTTDELTPNLRREVTTTRTTPVGGAATITNSGLVTLSVLARGGTGTVTNDGVIRGTLQVGTSAATNTTAVRTITAASDTTATTVNAAALAQTYTVNQNGSVLGGVFVIGGPTVSATVNLNNNSITVGDINAGTGNGQTNTNVNLNGAGFLGVASNDVPATGGSRITSVNTVTKTGDGNFVIVGAPLIRNAAAASTFTLELGTAAAPGTFRINGGEVQLGVAANPAIQGPEFGIRGNVENNSTLVVGRRIADGTGSAVQGINLLTTGNITNSGTGNLVMGVAPTLATFVPVGEADVPTSTNSFAMIDGNLNLGGRLTADFGNTRGIFTAGRAQDLFSVGGAFTSSAMVASTFNSPFISFVLTPRSEGGRTIVALDVRRADFSTVTSGDSNATGAANALQSAIPGVTSQIRTGGASDLGLVQDLGTVLTALDTQFTADQASQAFRDLSSGEFYGSLAAVRTTAAFGEAADTAIGSDAPAGLGLWLRPNVEVSRFGFNEDTNGSGIKAVSIGGTVGVNYSTGSGGNFGLAGGFSGQDVDARGTPEQAGADTYMVGVYGSQLSGPLSISGQVVLGWSNWDASRVLPTFSRVARSEFESRELRGTLRVGYDFSFGTGLTATPFAKVEARRYSFDGFDEQNAGGIGLAVERSSKTVMSPEVGLRLGGGYGSASGMRPFAEVSYIFQGNIDSTRRMSFLGARGTTFVVEGVRPENFIRSALGVSATVGGANIFLRGDYATEGDQKNSSVRAGFLFGF